MQKSSSKHLIHKRIKPFQGTLQAYSLSPSLTTAEFLIPQTESNVIATKRIISITWLEEHMPQGTKK